MYAILADIHGSRYALEKVIKDMQDFEIEGVILLGDLIDYGMQSNEVIELFRDEFKYKIICNIWGNHERAIMLDDYKGFSSKRGVDCAKFTASILTDNSREYLNEEMNKTGLQELDLAGKRCLAVHGSLEDYAWKAICPDDVHGDYSNYDIVFSGHSHYSHMFFKFYDADDPGRRNKHAVLFINPGSVGQPRNHNPSAQYALISDDLMTVMLRSVKYDIDAATLMYKGQVDSFYRDRLREGV